jgi:hypothetical protein
VIDCSEGTPTLVRQGKGEVELIGDWFLSYES